MQENQLVKKFMTKLGLTIEYPEQWEGREKDNVIVITKANQNGMPIFTLTIKKDAIDNNTDLTDYSKLTILEIIELTKNKPSSSKLMDIKIDGSEGKCVSYKYDFHGKQLKSFNAWYLQGNNAISAAYVARIEEFDDNFKLALRSILSIKSNI